VKGSDKQQCCRKPHPRFIRDCKFTGQKDEVFDVRWFSVIDPNFEKAANCIKVDYCQSVETIFIQVSSLLFTEYHSLDSLSCAEELAASITEKFNHKNPNLPSRVVDLSIPRTTTSFIQSLGLGITFYKTAGKLERALYLHIKNQTLCRRTHF
jgi:hypothetical protein